MNKRDLCAVVLAGGSGTRFWPLSRRLRPKQVLPLAPEAGGRTLLDETVARVAPLVADRILVVAPEHQVDPIGRATGVSRDRILVEPFAANTAPAVLLGALAASAGAPEAVVAVLPSDHVISSAETFRHDLADAARLAADREAIVTFGIAPIEPSTGFGYLERGEEVEPKTWEVAAFREKPDRKTAEEYVRAGQYYWNSGMFVFTVGRIVDAFLRHYPAVRAAVEEARTELAAGRPLDGTARRLYEALEPTSIDYAVMEKESGLLVREAGFDWSDVGSPSALAGLWPRDAEDNCVAHGRSASLDARGNVAVLENPDKLVALLGVEDLVVIDTEDALLVCPRGRDQDIRRMVALLQERGLEELL